MLAAALATALGIAVLDSLAWGVLRIPAWDASPSCSSSTLLPPLPAPEDGTSAAWHLDLEAWGVPPEVATGRIVFPAVGNLLYNMDPAKTASHGLHSRWTHAVANLPMLFGAVAAVAAWAAFVVCTNAFVLSGGAQETMKTL